MFRATFLFAASVLLNAGVPAMAADISAYQRGVLIQGPIETGDYAKLIRFVRHPDNYDRFARAVFLDSPGGDMVEAVKIAKLLDTSYAATHVASGARCYSACFILWMSGVTRQVSTAGTLGVHRVSLRGGGGLDQASETFSRIARSVENYMQQLGTPRAILEKMNMTAPTDMFVMSPRWLAEQQLLAALSYRLGFIDAAQSTCGPEPFAQAMKDKAVLSNEEEHRWVGQLTRWISCADELRARRQKVDEGMITALIGTGDAR